VTRKPSTLLICLAASAATVIVAACASSDEPAASASTQVPNTTTASNPVEIVRVFEDFEYYGACGNETVRVGGTMYYPVLPEHRDEIDVTRYAPDDDDSTASGFARVMPPGPGDDVGTMTVYSDGMARFESASGRIIWLTDAEQSYNWVC
jgi:hypothetical protein